MNPKVKAVLEAHGVHAGVAALPDGVVCGSVPGSTAFQTWDSLRRKFPETGLWPIIRGDADNPPEACELDGAEQTRNAPRGSIRELLKEAFEDRKEAYSDILDDLEGDETLEVFARKLDDGGVFEFAGRTPSPKPWPTKRDPTPVVFQSCKDLQTRKYFKAVQFALVPVRDPSETAAVLGFGGWNECPDPSVIVAALREWGQRYGALPACMTGDVLECFVERPPESEEAAVTLAAEQWLFCEDIVSQGTQSVRALAIELWRAPQWFFWWD